MIKKIKNDEVVNDKPDEVKKVVVPKIEIKSFTHLDLGIKVDDFNNILDEQLKRHNVKDKRDRVDIKKAVDRTSAIILLKIITNINKVGVK